MGPLDALSTGLVTQRPVSHSTDALHRTISPFPNIFLASNIEREKSKRKEKGHLPEDQDNRQGKNPISNYEQLVALAPYYSSLIAKKKKKN